jgi:hypothetical protein
VDSKKRELIQAVSDNRDALVVQYLTSLITLLTDEARKKSDEASDTEVYRNQGEIRAYKQLLNIFTRPIPPQ